MLANDIGRLLVVSREDPRKLVGYLGRTGVMQARHRRMQEEVVREQTWHWDRKAMHIRLFRGNNSTNQGAEAD